MNLIESTKEKLYREIEKLNDENADTVLKYVIKIRKTSKATDTLKKLAKNPTYRIPSGGNIEFEDVVPIKGKGIPGSKLLIEDRR